MKARALAPAWAKAKCEMAGRLTPIAKQRQKRLDIAPNAFENDFL
jgi:hypothetical protein